MYYTMNSQTIYQIKRFLLNFAEKMTDSFTRPQSYFIRDLLYGIAKSQSVILTDIARALGENIDLKYTLKRLSRNCLLFDAWQTLENNYFKAIRPSIQEDDVLILDGSDLVKSYGQKMEYITTIKDPVTNRYAKGYPTINVAIATQESKHPLPIYQKIYSPEAPDFISENIEIYKALDAADRLCEENNYITTGDRSFDRNDFMKYLLTRGRDFVIRMKKNRVVHYANQRLKEGRSLCRQLTLF